ncbi:MAG TPA: DUF1592 domain-containing protein [Polyangiaceae bacterium]|nr:DUF1592 domain-containing protein [Polyangiaceae bacterium]
MRFPKLSAALLATVAFGCEGGSPGANHGAAGSTAAGGASAVGGSAATGGTGTPISPDAVPGRVTLRRLNAREYDNTIRDLVGLDLKPSMSQQFPADEWGDGFDNDGDVLTTSSLSSEKYLNAAQAVVKAALADAGARAKLITCNIADAACPATALGELARRAWRRPVAADELAPYLTLVDLAKTKGDTDEVGLGLAMAAVLTSPDFLFLVEPDPMPNVVRQLTGFEQAARLSYFLWSSMPDEALFQAAAQGKLGQVAGITEQVQRMLGDPKASAFGEVLVSEWMQTVALKYAEPNATIFPNWKPTLRDAMEQELRLFLAPIVSGAAPTSDLLGATYTYANQELATFYGLPNAASLGDQFTKVDVDVSRRGGVLRQGSFLVLTSHPDRNSPTRRGKWILDRLLCSPPPPPPATVPALDTNAPFEGTLRQRLEQLHKNASTTCSGCHAIVDPMGFALENYDAVGQWRDMDGKYPVDATGTLPGTSVTFNGAADVTKAIVADPRFAACVAKQLMVFGLGRKVTDADKPLLNSLGDQFSKNGWKLPELTQMVASSVPMMFRQTEAQ